MDSKPLIDGKTREKWKEWFQQFRPCLYFHPPLKTNHNHSPLAGWAAGPRAEED